MPVTNPVCRPSRRSAHTSLPLGVAAAVDCSLKLFQLLACGGKITEEFCFRGEHSMHTTPTESPDPIPPQPIPPELLAWAQQTFDVDEYREGVREIKATGGQTFEAVIAEVEAVVRES